MSTVTPKSLRLSCGRHSLAKRSFVMTTWTTRAEIVERYFDRLTASDVEAIVALFADDGTVESPVLGTMPAAAFFATLDDASERNILSVHRIMSSPDARFFAAHFTYDWTLSAGGNVTFDGVDLFEFDDDGKLASLKIFYDTHPTRAEVGNKYQRPS